MGHLEFSQRIGHEFVINVEIVPPASSDCDVGISLRDALQGLPVSAVNIADSPMACARMSPLLCAATIGRDAGQRFECIPHLAVRDRNRIATQGLLWGAVANGIRSILVVSGDPVRNSNDRQARAVHDLNVSAAVNMARAEGLLVGVALDPRPSESEKAIRTLEQKLAAGASFVITQPLYDVNDLDHLARMIEPYDIPVLSGILPLVSLRHARFLHEKVPEITVPLHLLDAMEAAGDNACNAGIENAHTMFLEARQRLAGVCIMPPFNRFHLVSDILTRAYARNNEERL